MLRLGQEGVLTPDRPIGDGSHDLTGINPARVAGQILVQQRKALAGEGRRARASLSRRRCPGDRLLQGSRDTVTCDQVPDLADERGGMARKIMLCRRCCVRGNGRGIRHVRGLRRR